MTYVDAVKKLLETIKDEGSSKYFAIECIEEDDEIIYETTNEGIKKALEYAEAVDDVVGVRAYDKDKNTSLGWFGIEPFNDDLLDVIYDYTDNDYCAKIMNKLN